MALEFIMRNLSWNSMQQGPLKYGLIFILPYAPIFLYVDRLDDKSIIVYAFIYFLFYLFLTIFLGFKIRKLAKQWSEEEYEKLNSDQVTFPFILVLMVNAVIHFTIFYNILNWFVIL